jgi:hypothetical protein
VPIEKVIGEYRFAFALDSERTVVGWPPQPGDAYDTSTGFPIAGEAVVTKSFL